MRMFILNSHILAIIVSILLLVVSGQADELTKERANAIVQSIVKDQAPDKFSISFRSGLYQLTQNSTDAINLNEEGLIPYIGFESYVDLVKNFGLEARFYQAQNSLFPSTTPESNGTSANQRVYDFGMRYRWILDPTRTENYFVFKFMSHTYENNFEVFDADDETNDAVIYIEKYQALSLGIERSFYVTPIITVVASLDTLFITGLTNNSELEVDQSGIGFQVRGEAFLDLDVIGLPGRLGGAYWQGVYTNEFKDVDDEDQDSETTGKAAHAQSHRAVSASYSLLF